MSVKGAAGVNETVVPVAVTFPVTGIPPVLVRVKVALVIVAGSIASLNVAEITLLSVTPKDPPTGVVEVTVGKDEIAGIVVPPPLQAEIATLVINSNNDNVTCVNILPVMYFPHFTEMSFFASTRFWRLPVHLLSKTHSLADIISHPAPK